VPAVGPETELQIGSRSCSRRYRIPRNDRSGRDWRMPTLNVVWRLTPARSGVVEEVVAGDRGFSPVSIIEIPQVIGWVGCG
jgi:hypothetical protein